MYMSTLWLYHEKRRCKTTYMAATAALSCGLALMTMECLEEPVADLMMPSAVS